MDKIFNLKRIILNTLDSNKALDIVSIDLANKKKQHVRSLFYNGG